MFVNLGSKLVCMNDLAEADGATGGLGVEDRQVRTEEDLDISNEEAGVVDFHHHADLVTATPAVILEDGALDSLTVIYDDIRRQENNNNNRREGAQDSDQLTLYESIAGSLLRLDKIEVNFRFSWIANFVKASINPSVVIHTSRVST